MTTTIDLRVQYKMHTGDYPVWAQENEWHRKGIDQWNLFRDDDYQFKRHNYDSIDYHATFHGKPKSSYGLWLEEKLGVPKMLRYTYYKTFAKEAIYDNKSRQNGEFLTSLYIDWLEQELIKKLNKNA